MGGGRESKSSRSSTERRREVLSQMKAGASGLHSELGEHPYPMLLGYRKVDGRCNTWGKFPTEYILCVYGCPHSSYENKTPINRKKKRTKHAKDKLKNIF